MKKILLLLILCLITFYKTSFSLYAHFSQPSFYIDEHLIHALELLSHHHGKALCRVIDPGPFQRFDICYDQKNNHLYEVRYFDDYYEESPIKNGIKKEKHIIEKDYLFYATTKTTLGQNIKSFFNLSHFPGLSKEMIHDTERNAELFFAPFTTRIAEILLLNGDLNDSHVITHYETIGVQRARGESRFKIF